ncbi:MAG: DUF2303 family protein [Rickettsiales bacterium]|nr:DUF2303 family protein [Pseudomonadota bacterium]MDA0966849.1 DUF2303 family protein [Pseudomonadota bacterium]MDG4543524.1 DUF2303 family protein [Rickettsiales bacterium]MDG4545672.1 DUF2303 family protein [Rickettsiales bacterium]MDG4547555.1 DUF2303 family protein [Rickettsiales bacterium]
MSENNQYADILESVKQLYNPELKTVTHGDKSAEVLILPEGKKACDIKPFLDKYLTAPERRKGTAFVTQLNSFIDHVNRFKDDDSVIFANNEMSNPSLTAVIDYHKSTYEGEPRFGEHRTHYQFPLSKEWKSWLAFDGKQLSQADFAAFIEDRIGDVLHTYDGDLESDEKLKELAELLGGKFAGPSTLVAFSKNLEVNENSKVRNSNNLSSGEGALIYETEHVDSQGAPVKVPNMFLIGLPIFVGGDIYRVAVRLRYRIRSGSISWFYNLFRIENVFEDAFEGACEKAKRETGLPLFLGCPE